MRLFKYTTRDAALKILKSGTLQFSIYDALNDPFEFMLHNPPSLGGGEAPHYRDPLASGLLVCSFSAIPPYDAQAIAPWSHYAEGHRGVVLQFDSQAFSAALISKESRNKLPNDRIIPGIFYKVKYRKRLIRLNNYEPYQFVKGPLLNKSRAWEYEREFRVFGQIDSPWSYNLKKNFFTRLGREYIQRDSKLVSRGRLLYPFPRKALECVYFGCQQDIEYDTSLVNAIYRTLKKYPDCSYDYLNASNNAYCLEISI